MGCGTFAHFNFIPVGRGREMIDMDLTPDQREELLRKLQRHLEEGKIGVLSTAPQFGRACILYGRTGSSPQGTRAGERGRRQWCWRATSAVSVGKAAVPREDVMRIVAPINDVPHSSAHSFWPAIRPDM